MASAERSSVQAAAERWYCLLRRGRGCLVWKGEFTHKYGFPSTSISDDSTRGPTCVPEESCVSWPLDCSNTRGPGLSESTGTPFCTTESSPPLPVSASESLSELESSLLPRYRFLEAPTPAVVLLVVAPLACGGGLAGFDGFSLKMQLRWTPRDLQCTQGKILLH